MQTKIEAPATAQNGESIQTDAAPAQPQPRTTPDRTAAGSTSAAGSERDAGTIVPPLNPGTISKLSDNALIAACKSQFRATDSSYSLFRRDKELLAAIYDEMVDRFRDEKLKGEKRDTKPTLKQAFALAGWNYDAARKFRRRHEQDKNRRVLTSYENPPKPPLLLEGDIVKLKDKEADAEYMVVNVHESAPKVDVVPKASANGKTLTIATESVTKVVVSVRKIKLNDLILCDDNGAEYQYVGGGKFSRTKTATLLEQKHERELAAIKKKEQHEKDKTEEKKRQQEIRKAEATRRELEKIAEKERRKAEANAKKEAARTKRNAAAAQRANKRSKETTTEPAGSSIKTDLVKVARIGDTQEFGVFPESCIQCNTDNALTIGTRDLCEVERDRINKKRLAQQSAAETKPDVAAMAASGPAVSILAEVPLG